MKHVHHWVLDAPKGDQVKAKCQSCPATRTFPAGDEPIPVIRRKRTPPPEASGPGSDGAIPAAYHALIREIAAADHRIIQFTAALAALEPLLPSETQQEASP